MTVDVCSELRAFTGIIITGEEGWGSGANDFVSRAKSTVGFAPRR